MKITNVQHNPLIPDILVLLRQHPAGINEYKIHRALDQHDAFKAIGNDGSLLLFKKHFMIMNALYQLRQTIWESEQRILSISPLDIRLAKPSSNVSVTTSLKEHKSLSDYYLDWSNYENTQESDVEKLLDDFWQRFINQDARADALQQLGLESSASIKQIGRRYRELAAQHHPDKGGDKEIFIRIRRAYEVLK